MGSAGDAAVDEAGVVTVGRSTVEGPTAGRLIRKEDGRAALTLSFGRGKGVEEWASWTSVGGTVCLPFLLCVGVGVEGWCMFERESLSFIGGRPCGGEFTMRASGRGGWRFGDGGLAGRWNYFSERLRGLRGEAFDYFVNRYLIHVTQI